MANLPEILTHVSIIIFIYVSLIFIIAWILKDNGIMDIAWGIGFLIITWYSYTNIGEPDARKFLVFILVILWGVRLSGYIFIRNLGRDEDFRYRNWREKWGQWAALRSYFQVFLLQGFLMLVFATPIIFIQVLSSMPINMIDILGTAVWTVGWLFESVADYQMYRFKNRSKTDKQVMDQGLWKYSRHPNYFGESLCWWGIWLIAFSVPYGWITVISPILLTYFLVRVSGIPMLEKKYQQNEAYQEYVEKTYAFFPGPPKNQDSPKKQ